MEPKPNQPLNPDAHAQAPARDRWYLRAQGRTLGPLEAEEVKIGLETGEFLPGDKIANSRNPSWQLMSEHPVFQRFISSEEIPRSKMLVTPPPPQLLRVKPQPAPAAMPAAIPVPPPVPVFTAPPQISIPVEVRATPPKKKKPTKPKRLSGIALELISSVPPTVLRELPDAPAAPIDPETNAALDQATKELERFLKTLKKTEAPLEAIVAPAPIPLRPSYEPIFIGKPEPVVEPKKKPEGRVIQIELKLPEKPWQWLVVIAALALAALLIFGGIGKSEKQFGFGPEENKTRDLKDSRLPDPSSPTSTPLEAGDPVPPLKAPTRPQRE